MSLLIWGMPELNCRYGLTLARYSGIITSLDLLAVLLLMQSRTCLPSSLPEFSAGSCSACSAPGPPEPVSQSCFPHSLRTAFTITWVYSRCRTLPLLKLVHFLNRLWLISVWWLLLLSHPPHLIVQCHSQTLCGYNSIQIVLKVLNSSRPSASP